MPEMALTLRVLDLSLGGCALWCPADVPPLQPGTRLAIASGLTLENASIQSRSVAAWKKSPSGPDAQTPAVFAIGV